MSQFSHSGVYTITQAPPRTQIYLTQERDYGSPLCAKRACTNGGKYHLAHLIEQTWKTVEMSWGDAWCQFHKCVACETVVFDERREDHRAMKALILEQRNRQYINPMVHWKDEEEESPDQGQADPPGWNDVCTCR